MRDWSNMWEDPDAFADAATRRCLRVWCEARAARLVLTLGESLWVLGTAPDQRPDVRALVADLRRCTATSFAAARLDVMEPPDESPTVAEEVAADGWSLLSAYLRGDRARDLVHSYLRALASILLVGDVVSEPRDAWLAAQVELVTTWLSADSDAAGVFDALWSRYGYVVSFVDEHYEHGDLRTWRSR